MNIFNILYTQVTFQSNLSKLILSSLQVVLVLTSSVNAELEFSEGSQLMESWNTWWNMQEKVREAVFLSAVKSAWTNLLAALESFVSGNTKDAGTSPRPPIRPICERRLARPEPSARPAGLPIHWREEREIACGLGSSLWWANLVWPLVSSPVSPGPDNCPPIWRLCHGWAVTAVERLNPNIRSRGDYRALSEGLSEGWC